MDGSRPNQTMGSWRIDRRTLLTRAALVAAAPSLASLVAVGGQRQALAAQATPVSSGAAATPAVDVAGELPSWNEGPTKQAILDFVVAVTDATGDDFVHPAQRIATFDLDGTLWVSHPMYIELVFAFDRVRALAPEHPEWQTQEPYATILAGVDPATMTDFTEQDISALLAEAHAGFTVAEYETTVAEWLATSRHPRFDVPYTDLVYQPMREVMALFRRNEFTVYIVSGSGQEFIRAFAQSVLGVAPEHVIGSASQTTYEVRKGQPSLVMQPEVLFVDDHGGKPEGINLIVGQRPIAAFGNSDGDREMLEWTDSGAGARLMALVHHDDAEREYDYGADNTVGLFSAALMTEAEERGWNVISMKDDWRQIFPA